MNVLFQAVVADYVQNGKRTLLDLNVRLRHHLIRLLGTSGQPSFRARTSSATSPRGGRRTQLTQRSTGNWRLSVALSAWLRKKIRP